MSPHPLSSIPVWKRINRLRKNSTPKNIGILEVNGTQLSNDVDKANTMAEWLKQIFKNENIAEFYNDPYSTTYKIIEKAGIDSLYPENSKRVKPLSMQELKRAVRKFKQQNLYRQEWHIKQNVSKNISEISKTCNGWHIMFCTKFEA